MEITLTKIYDLVVSSNSFGILQLANLFTQESQKVLAMYDKLAPAPYSLPLFDKQGVALTVMWNTAKLLFHKDYITKDLTKLEYADSISDFLYHLELENEGFASLADPYTYERFLKNKLGKLPRTTTELYDRFSVNYFFRTVLDSIVMFFTGVLPPFNTAPFVRTLFSVLNGVSKKTLNDLSLILVEDANFEKLSAEKIIKIRDESNNLKLELSYYDRFLRTKRLILDNANSFIPFSFTIDLDSRYIPSALSYYIIYIDSDGYMPADLEKVWFIRRVKDTQLVFTNFAEDLTKDRESLCRLVEKVFPTFVLTDYRLSVPHGLRFSDKVLYKGLDSFRYQYADKVLYAGETYYRELGSDGAIYFPNYVIKRGIWNHA